MVNIFEKQYDVDNEENSQERVNKSYDSFEEYVEHLLNDKSKNMYNSLPRQCKIISHVVDGNTITLEFEHPVFRKKVIHTGKLMDG